MNSESMQVEGQRLHPMSIPFRLLAHGRTFLLPVLLFLLFASGNKWEMWAAFGLIPVAIFEAFRYFVTRYTITDTELIVRQGLIFRSVRHIPLRRIQNIDHTQNPLHRLFGVAEVRVETAGGAKPEAELKVLSLDQIEEMKKGVFGRPSSVSMDDAQAEEVNAAASEATDAPRPGARTLLALGSVDLLKLAVVTNRGMIGFAIIAGLAWQFNLDDQIAKLSFVESLVDFVKQAPPLMSVAMTAAGFIALYILFSIMWSFINFHDFRLELVGDDLRVNTGLFSRLSATIPVQRIQLVIVRQSLIHRWLGVSTVIVQTAGGGGDMENKTHIGRKWIAPIIPDDNVPALLEILQPQIDRDVSHWRMMSRKAVRRATRKALKFSPLVAGAALALSFISGNVYLLIGAPIFMAYLIWICRADMRAVSCAVTADGVFFRNGVFTRTLSSTSFDRIQSVAEDESPFDRKWRMSTLVVDTAGGNSLSHKIKVPYLEQDDARAFRDTIVSRVARTELAWS